MKEYRITIYQQLIFWAFVVVCTFIPSTAMAEKADGLQIELQSTPVYDTIKPDVDEVQFSILVNDQQGQPVKNVELTFTMESPAKKFFPSTDFPVVEGTTLMEGKVLVPDGKLDFKYVFPIRGEYTLKVKAVPNASPDQAAEKTLHFNIKENPSEVWNAVIFILVLLFLGFITGYILTSRRAAKEAV